MDRRYFSIFTMISSKTAMKKVMKGAFLKLILNNLKNYMNFVIIYFLPERMKIVMKLERMKLESLQLSYIIKLNKIKSWIRFEKNSDSD